MVVLCLVEQLDVGTLVDPVDLALEKFWNVNGKREDEDREDVVPGLPRVRGEMEGETNA